jgi:hypothetical protein
MALTCSVGGARQTFVGPLADDVARTLENAFGAEGDWEEADSRGFGEWPEPAWTALCAKATQDLGADALPNLLAIDKPGRCVVLPAFVSAVCLPLTDGSSLRCASLIGLRSELGALSELWGLPLDDDGLNEILEQSDGELTREVEAFARLALAANTATRKGCPLWLFV